MAKKVKDSFIVFYEWEDNLRKLSDEQMGQVFRAIFAYEKRGEKYNGADFAVDMAMNFIYGVIDRNRERYEETCRQRSIAGAKGGAPKGNRNASKRAKQANGLSDNQNQAKQAEHESEREYERERESERESESEREPVPEREREKIDAGAYDSVFFALQERISSHISEDTAREVREWCEDMGEERVIEAIHLAANIGKRSWGYVKGILNNWLEEECSSPVLPLNESYSPPDWLANECMVKRVMGREEVSDNAPQPGCCGAFIHGGVGLSVKCRHPDHDCIYRTHCNL